MKQYISILLSALLLCFISSCSTEETGNSISNDYTMSFDISIVDYGEASRASSVSFSNNDKIYMVFYNTNGTKVNYGTATYSSGKWTLTPNSSFSNGSGDVEMYYFVGASSATASQVSCTATTAVYSCAGTWQFASNNLTVSGKMTPLFSRVYFKGTSGTSFTIGNMETPSTYNIADGTMTTMTGSVSTSIQSSGLSAYTYCTSSSFSSLSVIVGGVTYSKNSVPSASSPVSVYMTLPTSANHVGWSSSSDGDKEAEEYEPVASDHEAVDLGLSVKWATCNVGASKPEEYGLYFAWGETVGYGSDTKDGRSFDWASYKWMVPGQSSWQYCTKYTFADGQTSANWYSNGTYVGSTVDGMTYKNKTTLDKEDDAASVNWGGKWRMPTEAEQDELLTKCTWTWTSVNGVYGRKVTGPNGNSIFLPAAGYRYGAYLYYAGAYGYYWSSSLSEYFSYSACGLGFFSGNVGKIYYSRYDGQSVRAVCP